MWSHGSSVIWNLVSLASEIYYLSHCLYLRVRPLLGSCRWCNPIKYLRYTWLGFTPRSTRAGAIPWAFMWQYYSLVFDDKTRFDGATVAQFREDFKFDMRIPLPWLLWLARLGDVVPMSEMCDISVDISWYNDFWSSTMVKQQRCFLWTPFMCNGCEGMQISLAPPFLLLSLSSSLSLLKLQRSYLDKWCAFELLSYSLSIW